ncbi:MAG: hypothetical protein AAF564_22210 [Bacteroidota bacterium]
MSDTIEVFMPARVFTDKICALQSAEKAIKKASRDFNVAEAIRNAGFADSVFTELNAAIRGDLGYPESDPLELNVSRDDYHAWLRDMVQLRKAWRDASKAAEVRLCAEFSFDLAKKGQEIFDWVPADLMPGDDANEGDKP